MAKETVSGVNPVYEILRSGKRRVHRIWVAHREKGGVVGKIFELAAEKNVPVQKSTPEDIFRRSRIEKHQGIVAEVDSFLYSSLDDILRAGESDDRGHFILVLDNIIDPQNLGSIIRTAHLLGVHGVVIPERNSAEISPASSRASAGAVEYIPIAKVTNISRTLELLKEKGIWVVGAEVGGEDLYSFDFSGSCAIVLGSEGRGMRRLVRDNCDKLLTIPMSSGRGGVNSYNVSASAAIFLYEAARQRGFRGNRKK